MRGSGAAMMARVVMVGIDPDQVDFSDPALPPGMNADIIRRGIARSLDLMREAGHDAQPMVISADAAGIERVAARLAQGEVDCVTIGGGVHRPPSNLLLFETIVNLAAQSPSRPAIAFISRPDEAVDGVKRVLE
jgi:hypothetical protein